MAHGRLVAVSYPVDGEFTFRFIQLLSSAARTTGNRVISPAGR